MNKNKLKQMLQKNECTYGSWLTISNILIPEILSFASFDWLTIDMEHSSIELSDVLPLIISIEKNNMVPLVRIGENNSNLIKRIMDAGAYGIIVANICNKIEAEKVVNAVKYPPIGNRGVGLYRAQGFGETFKDYKKWVKDESIVIIQIEHINAVNNINEIFSVKGIDAFMVGPYDLSASLGKPGDFESDAFKDALNTIQTAAKKYNLCSGFHSVSSDPKEVIKLREQGYKFLAYSVDSILLKDIAVNSMDIIEGRRL